MNARITRVWMLFFCFIFLAGFSFAANRLIIVAPGETFTETTGKSGSAAPQTAGVPFSVTVYSVDDFDWSYASTLENVAMTAGETAAFSPSSLTLNQDEGAVTDCKYYPVQVTIGGSVEGQVGIYANNSPYNGLASGTVTITAQNIEHYYFESIPDQTAGQSFSYTITARDSSDTTVTSFNGTGTLTARYSVSGDLYSWGVNFTDGVATGTITIYDASGGETVQLVCETTEPAVTTNQNNNTFNVAAGTFDRLLVIGPGQTYLPGTTSGNGRAGTSESTSQQEAGAPFYVTVYACDRYWNTVPGAEGTVDLTSSDGQAVFNPSGSEALSGGTVNFNVDLRTTGSGSQTIQAALQAGGVDNDTDTVPLIHSGLSKFGFTQSITEKTAGEIFPVAAAAFDAYNNTVTSFTQSATIEVFVGGSELGSSYWTSSAMNFTNGILGANYVRIFKRTSNAAIRLSYSGNQGDSNAFNVIPGNYTKLMTIAPGEGYDPGNVSGGKLTYTAGPVTAGVATLIYVYATDQYGNRVTDVDGNVIRITTSDSAATVDGQPASPSGVTITAQDGQGSFNIVFQTTRTYPPGQTVSGHDETQSSTDGSSAIPVVSSELSYFEIANIPTETNADTVNSNIRIRAKDEYGNTITDWDGDIWMTLPGSDYTAPFETTMDVTGTNIELVGHRWHVTITAGDLGDKQVAINFRRAMTGLEVFVSDNETDTPTAYSGNIGASSSFNVNPGDHTQMQVIPPGVEARPGTTDGENGNPTGQSVSNAFHVTVSAVDRYYNIVTTRQDTVRLSSNIPSNTLVDSQEPAAAPGGVPKALINGTIIYSVEYTNIAGSSSFYLIANSSVSGVSEGQSKTINIFNIHHFKIEAPESSDWQEAGRSFRITITAYNDEGEYQVADGFTGTVDLSTNRDWADLGKVIQPGDSIPFTAGICEMDVTIYRASTSAYGSGGYTLYATFGNVKSNTLGNINVRNKPASDVLVIAEGMQYRPGAKHLGIPGYKGYVSSPRIMEAGDPFQLQVYYVDEYYNQDVYYNDFCKLTSTDALATENSRWLATENVHVTITAGVYPVGAPWANAVLRTVGDTGQQYFTAEPEGSLPNNTTPPINLRHTDHDHFGILLPGSRTAIAGVPFNVTMQALDEWQNVCDDRNQGTPFEELVNLNSSEGSNTMWPGQYSFTNGQAIVPVQLFKAETFNTHIEAVYSGITGTSASNGGGMHVYPNEFERLIIISQEGMALDNGRFSGTTPTEFPGYSGSPYFSAYGNKVNDGEASGGPAAGYQFTVYSCDVYGNITATADVLGHTVNISTNDAYAVPITPTAISSSTGSAVFNAIFHTAMEGVSLTAEITNEAIADFTTPAFTTYAGVPYGLQLMVPGLAPVPGSGYVDGFSNWYNGVTGLTNTQLSSVGFPVTVQASDKFGNFVVVSDIVDVWQASPNPSYPTSTNRFTGNLGNAAPGILTLTATATLSMPQYIQFSANDYASGYTLSDSNEWLVIPTVYVAMAGDLEYVIDIGYGDEVVSYGDGTNSINVVADPETFTMNVYAVDSVSGMPVYGASQLFQLRPVLANDINTEAPGNLQISNGTTSNGSFLTVNQSYDASGSIRIEVSDPEGGLDTRYSCVIHIGANAESSEFDAYPNPANIRSGQQTDITGILTYNSTYPVEGEPVYFEFLSVSSTGSGSFAGGAVTITVNTDSSGNAIAPFTGDYVNGSCLIRATHLTTGQWEYVTVNISLVDPVLGEVSNYPNPFRAGVESTNISYLLAEPSDVKLKIYNLFGDLVLSREFRSGRQYAAAGVMNVFPWDGRNDKGEVVGNGGYICVIEAVINGSNEKLIRKIAVRK